MRYFGQTVFFTCELVSNDLLSDKLSGIVYDCMMIMITKLKALARDCVLTLK